jgi:hypothetical protein
MEVAAVALAGSATALATGLGAIPVFLLGARAERLRRPGWHALEGAIFLGSLAIVWLGASLAH